MQDFTYFYDKILSFYNVKTLKDLSEVTNIPISTLSSIKQRNSITALKKKCRELNIFDEIFGDINSGISINQGNSSRAAARNYFEGSKKNELDNLIPESILIELNSLYERIKNKDEDFVKNVTYEIEDYINEIKRKTRN